MTVIEYAKGPRDPRFVVRLLDAGEPVRSQSEVLLERANEILVARGVAPVAASQVELLSALDLAQAELGRYVPESTPVFRDAQPTVKVDGTLVPVDQDTVELDRKISAHLAVISKDWDREVTVDDYVRAAAELRATGRLRVSS